MKVSATTIQQGATIFYRSHIRAIEEVQFAKTGRSIVGGIKFSENRNPCLTCIRSTKKQQEAIGKMGEDIKPMRTFNSLVLKHHNSKSRLSKKSHEIFCTVNICYFLDCIIFGDNIISDFEIEECVISGDLEEVHKEGIDDEGIAAAVIDFAISIIILVYIMTT